MNIFAVTAIARGYDFFVAMDASQKRPEFECVGHEIVTVCDYLNILTCPHRKHNLASDAWCARHGVGCMHVAGRNRPRVGVVRATVEASCYTLS